MVTSIIKHPQHLWESSHLVSFWWSETWLRNLSVWISCFGIFTYFHLSYQIYTGDLFTDEEGCQDLPGGGRRDFNRSSSCCSPRWYINVPVHGQFVPGLACHTIRFSLQCTMWCKQLREAGGNSIRQVVVFDFSTNYDASVKSWIQRWECYGTSSSAVKQGKSPQTYRNLGGKRSYYQNWVECELCLCPVRATSPQFFGTQQQFSARSLQADRQLDIWTTDCQVHENTGRWFWRWIFGNMKNTIYPYFRLASLSTFWQSGDTLRCDSLWILALYQPLSTLVVREPSGILVPELKGFKWWNVASRYDMGNMMIWLNMVQWFSKNQLILVKRIEQVDVWSFISFTFTFTDSFLMRF